MEHIDSETREGNIKHINVFKKKVSNDCVQQQKHPNLPRQQMMNPHMPQTAQISQSLSIKNLALLKRDLSSDFISQQQKHSMTGTTLKQGENHLHNTMLIKSISTNSNFPQQPTINQVNLINQNTARSRSTYKGLTQTMQSPLDSQNDLTLTSTQFFKQVSDFAKGLKSDSVNFKMNYLSPNSEADSHGFPYMKKQHLHKVSGISQKLNDPEEVPDEDQNHKATSTNTEFLDLKPYERSMLISVMEETLVSQNDKIERQSLKIKQLKSDKTEQSDAISQIQRANQQIYSEYRSLQEYVESLLNSSQQERILANVGSCKDVVVRCIMNIVECLSFYKDLVKISKETDGRYLKSRLESYLESEGERLSQTVFNTQVFEQKLQDMTGFMEELSASERYRVNKDGIVAKQVDFEGKIIQFQSLIDKCQTLQNQLASKEQQVTKAKTLEQQQLKKKVRELEKIVDQQLNNGQADSKKFYTVMREHENMKMLLSKIQVQNTQYKLAIKGLRDITDSKHASQQNTRSESTSTSKKLKKLYSQIQEESLKLIDQSNTQISQETSDLTHLLTSVITCHSQFKLLSDNFQTELGKDQLDIQHQLSTLINKLSHLEQERAKRYNSTQTKYEKQQSSYQQLTQELAKFKDENQFLKKQASNESIQKTFEQLSTILIQGASSSTLSDQQYQLISQIFGKQISSVSENQKSQLVIKDKELNDLRLEKLQILDQLKQAYELNIRVVNDIVELLKMTGLGAQTKAYEGHQKQLVGQLEALQKQIDSVNLLDNSFSMLDLHSQLKLIDDDFDTKTDRQSLALNRVRSQGSVSRKRLLKSRIKELEEKLNYLEMENVSLQNSLRKSVFQEQAHVSNIETQEMIALRKKRKLLKSKSDPKTLEQARQQMRQYGIQYNNARLEEVELVADSDAQKNTFETSQVISPSKLNERLPLITQITMSATSQNRIFAKASHLSSQNPLMNPLLEEVIKEMDEAHLNSNQQLYSLINVQAKALEEVMNRQKLNMREQSFEMVKPNKRYKNSEPDQHMSDV